MYCGHGGTGVLCGCLSWNSSAHSINSVSSVMSCYHSRCFLFISKIFDNIYNMTLLMAIWCPHIWTEVSSPITNGPCFEIVNKETQFILKCCFQKWTDNARIVEEYKINSPFPPMPEPQYTCFEKFKQRANSYAVVCVFQVCIIVKYNTSPVPSRPAGLQT